MTHEAVVVGAGLMGLATGWALVQRGIRPLVLDGFARGHSRGASHGETRNINDAYADDRYLDLLTRARTGWRRLESADDEPLLRLHGLVTHGDPADLDPVFTALRARGHAVDLIDGTAAAARWPLMRFDVAALVSEHAGVVRAAAALDALERRITAGGGTVRRDARVTGLVPDADGVDVCLRDGRVRADVVAVTAGAWTTSLLDGIVDLPRLVVTEESPAHFRPLHVDARWPSFNHAPSDDARSRTPVPGPVYGMPSPGEGVKVGFHRVGPEVDPDDRPFRPSHEHALRAYVAEWFPGLDPDSAAPISCTYTSTDSGDFLLDRVGRVVVGAGFSGHGFKFGPAIGEVLADLVIDADAPSDFRIARLATI